MKKITKKRTQTFFFHLPARNVYIFYTDSCACVDRVSGAETLTPSNSCEYAWKVWHPSQSKQFRTQNKTRRWWMWLGRAQMSHHWRRKPTIDVCLVTNLICVDEGIPHLPGHCILIVWPGAVRIHRSATADLRIFLILSLRQKLVINYCQRRTTKRDQNSTGPCWTRQIFIHLWPSLVCHILQICCAYWQVMAKAQPPWCWL